MRALPSLLIVLAFLIVSTPRPADAAAYEMRYEETCNNGRSDITFVWTFSAAPLGQWLDLGVDSTFQPGTFRGVGPLSPTTFRYTWTGLEPAARYYVRVNQPSPGGGWDTSPTWNFTTNCAAAAQQPVVYLTQEQFAFAIPCSGQRPAGTEGLPCTIPAGARIVIVGSGSASGLASSSRTETVTVERIFDLEDKVLVSRRYGELWLLEYGFGCSGLWLREGRTVIIDSPSLFASIGSKIIIPDRDQSCRIWNSTQIR